jgi:hypothetical protein
MGSNLAVKVRYFPALMKLRDFPTEEPVLDTEPRKG